MRHHRRREIQTVVWCCAVWTTVLFRSSDRMTQNKHRRGLVLLFRRLCLEHLCAHPRVFFNKYTNTKRVYMYELIGRAEWHRRHQKGCWSCFVSSCLERCNIINNNKHQTTTIDTTTTTITYTTTTPQPNTPPPLPPPPPTRQNKACLPARLRHGRTHSHPGIAYIRRIQHKPQRHAVSHIVSLGQSPKGTRQIGVRHAPSMDQHYGYERGRPQLQATAGQIGERLQAFLLGWWRLFCYALVALIGTGLLLFIKVCR